MNEKKDTNTNALIGIIIVIVILVSIAAYNLFIEPNRTTSRIIKSRPLVELESAASAAWQKIESSFDKDEDLTNEYLKLKE